MKLEFSNNGNVLEEVLNEFNLKTEAIARFVNNSQIMGIEDYKMAAEIDYEHFEQDMKLRIAEKFKKARQKLKELVASKLENYDQLRLSKLTDRAVQTNTTNNPDK